MIFDSVDTSLSYLSKSSLFSHFNSSFDLIIFQKISRKYLISLWIQPLFTIIPLNSRYIHQIGQFGIIFDTRPFEIDNLAVSARQMLMVVIQMNFGMDSNIDEWSAGNLL